MTFFDIARKNIKKKFGSYLIYFFSTAFSVIIFNLFCSLYYNPAFVAYRFGKGKITTLFKGAAVAVLLFAFVFVLYSGSYFIKTQKKEIAIYSLLGMRKEQIAIMMFLETLLLGIAAVLFGVIAGGLSAGYLSSFLMRFMATGTSVSFSVDLRAVLITIISFCILFLMSGVQAYRTIYKYTLIELLSAEKQNEGVPKYSVVGAVAAFILLAVGYGISAFMNLNESGTKLLLPSFIVIVLVSAGTFFLFHNLIPMLVDLLKRKQTLYYQTSNFISISQIAFRLKANSNMLSIIALLCATTITMISASYSLYKGLEDGTDYYAPYSYLAKGITQQQHREIQKTVSDLGEVELVADDEICLINAKMQQNEYRIQEGDGKSISNGEPVNAYILSESKYLKIIKDTETPVGEYTNIRSDFSGGLNDTECYFIDGNVTDTYCRGLVGKEIDLLFQDKVNEYQVTGAGLHKYIGLLDLYQHPTVVVSDKVYESYYKEAKESEMDTFYGFMFHDEMVSSATVAAIDKIVPARFHNGGLPGNSNYIGIYKANFSLYGSYVFIGFFIGILFILATGSVMYYKLIMEAQEEAFRYNILRKTGMKQGEIRLSIIKQLAIVYGIPLFIGLLHTVFALRTYNRMLELIGQENPTFLNALQVVVLFVVVYGLFYILSVKSYYRIVCSSSE